MLSVFSVSAFAPVPLNLRLSMEQRNTRSYLFFQPKHLLTKRPVLEIRQWIKTPAGITAGEQPLDKKSLKTYFPKLTEDGIKLILGFTRAELQKTELALINQSLYLHNEEERNRLRKKGMVRHLQTLFSSLRHYVQHLELHHPVTTAGSAAIQTLKCSLHHYSVELAFAVIEKEAHYAFLVSVVNGKEKKAISGYKRYHFFLEKENVYYQLSSKSYEAAEWLEEQEQQQWTKEDTSKIKEAASFLKEKGLVVDDSSLESGEQLIAEPQGQVLLSELNNTFLKLEPRFLYDGYVVDGPFEATSKVSQNGTTINIARHKEKEEELVSFLRSLHPKFSSQNNGFFYLNFDEAQKKGWFLNVYHRLLEMEIDLPGVDLLKHFRYSTHKAETTVKQLKTEGNWITLSFQLKFGKEKIPLHYLQKSLFNGQKAILLKDGSFGVLGDEWMKQYGQLLRHGKAGKEEIYVPRWLFMSEEIDTGTQQQTNTTEPPVKTTISQDWFAKWKQWEKQTEPLFAIPAALKIKNLRPYQQKGYEWLRLLSEIGGSGCLADDMGLGKTVQTIAFLLHKLEINPAGKHLVVAPASLLYNWQEELKKFAPAVQSLVFHGAKREEEELVNPDYPVIITSYGTLRQDSEKLIGTTWSTVVIDESHHIKNPSAQITRTVWQLSAETKIALSGTPVMNGTEDLFSQVHFLLPGLLGSAEFFRREYAIPIKLKGDKEKAGVLQKLIKPFVLRRTKEQAAPDLPAKTESILWCEMETEQRTAYESIKEDIRGNILLDIEQNGLNKGKMSVLAGLTKLRQLCNSCELVKDEDLFAYSSIKTKILIEELKSIIPQHRALVFSQFTSMLDLLERDLQKENIPVIRLDGQTNAAERQKLVASFQQEESEAAVFLISLKAGNAGLNLTRADYVFLFDPWWNTAVENQAIDRTHRIGQQQAVFAYRLICKDSIEEKIIKMASGKKKIAEDLITADEGFVKSLTLDDIRYLLE